MSINGKVSPFQAPAGTPIVGQPFTVLRVGIPVNLVLTCNCSMDGPPLEILMSAPTTCPRCRKVYRAFFNPTNGQVQMHVGAPEPEPVAS